MEGFRFTLFNDLTLLVLALTLATLAGRLRGRLHANWPLAYYLVVLGHSLGFARGINGYAVAAGLVAGAAQRFDGYWQVAWAVEVAALACIAWRSIGLLLMWPACAPLCGW